MTKRIKNSYKDIYNFVNNKHLRKIKTRFKNSKKEELIDLSLYYLDLYIKVLLCFYKLNLK